ncbi:MAG: ATP synthase F1 subunit gamma [Thermodesulfobacteriota bacterium]
MPSLKQITTKISSVKGTRRIMSAMKLIAAVKLQRSQAMLNEFRPYSDGYKEIVLGVAGKCDPKHHQLLRKPEEIKKVHFVFFTSDRGLCGSFNTGLIRNFENHIDSMSNEKGNITMSFVGRRGKDHCSTSGYELGDYFSGASEKNYTEIAKKLSNNAIEMFQKEETDEVVLVYNYFRSALIQEITFEKLLPLNVEKNEEPSGTDYLYEPSRERIIGEIIPKFIQIRIERAIQESLTSEHASRMTAMENATNNADDVIKKLTLLFNKTRQAMITTELMDIVNGTEAQKKGGNE